MYMYTRQVPGIMTIDVEVANNIKTHFFTKNYIFKVEIKKFLFSWVETEAWKIKL